MASLRSPESETLTLRPLSLFLLAILSLLAGAPSSTAVNFLFNPFDPNSNGTAITLITDASFENSVVLLINDSNPFSVGRAIYPTRIPVLRRRSGNSSAASAISFSTSFVFSILPEIATSPGFGLCFFLSNSSSLPGNIAGQYFGLFSNTTTPSVSPLVAVEFDTGRNTDFNDIDGNHIGVNLNNVESVNSSTAGYYNASGSFVPVAMRDGGNVRAWIDFNGVDFSFTVSVAPASFPRPRIPTLSYSSPTIADYLAEEMFIGFSASKTEWVEVRRILAWSFSDSGPAREINTTGFPLFRNPRNPSSLPPAAIAGISAGAAVIFLAAASLLAFWILWRRRKEERDDEGEIEEWEMEYWPHRYEYEELSKATNGFSDENLIGSGGFGKVYRAGEAAVKCVSQESKQGLREFMAEISSMGRLQHKSLVPMRGWCNHSGLLMLVYDYMPNGSLNHLIFSRSATSPPMPWPLRRRVLSDVAEALAYLHGGYDQVVIHRDVKSSNILLDSEMRARLGDFGLAKLYGHGEAAGTTRVVGTLGYMAPELATSAAPTAASDVYSFGVVALEVACGRRPIEMDAPEDEAVLVDWVRDLYVAGRVVDAVDPRLPEGEVEVVLKLGLACCHPDPVRRPTMAEVVAVLLGEGAAAAAPGEVLSALVAGGQSG